MEGRPGRPRRARPIVLLHCFTCSIRWWDELIPLLDRDHRVIAVDLLGHGGSEKPTDGYSIENQAQRVAQVLAQLRVEGATVVGHSLGGTVAVALAERSRELVDRLVIVDQAPDNDYGDGRGLLAEVTFFPGLRRSRRVRRRPAADELRSLRSVPRRRGRLHRGDAARRARARELRPAAGDLRIGGQNLRRERVPSAYAELPGARTELIEDAGHSPNVEAPEETARLIFDFAPEAAPSPSARADRNRASGRGRERPRSRASSEDR
jgi:pimeloyl-ACP methyl ester carboxylesterase